MDHATLVQRAERWLRNQGCGVVFTDSMSAATWNGEQPDAIGWRHGRISIVIECKSSRSDFLSDHKKIHRRDGTGCGDWRFFLAPAGMINPDEVPYGWGLLEAKGKRVLKTLGVPGNCHWYAHAPFEGNKLCEMQIMYSALRRFAVRGMLETVYEPIPTGGNDNG